MVFQSVATTHRKFLESGLESFWNLTRKSDSKINFGIKISGDSEWNLFGIKFLQRFQEWFHFDSNFIPKLESGENGIKMESFFVLYSKNIPKLWFHFWNQDTNFGIKCISNNTGINFWALFQKYWEKLIQFLESGYQFWNQVHFE